MDDFQPDQPDFQADDFQPDTAPQQARPSLFKQAGNIIDRYNQTQLGSPSQLLQSVQPLMSKVSNYVGEKATEALSQGPNRVDPYTAAAVGTLATISPDVAMGAVAPSSEFKGASQPLFRSASQPMAQRALGFTKRFLNTPFARGKAAQASEVALEKNVIPFSGSATKAMARAQDLQQASGDALGSMRESVGSAEISPVFDSLEAARHRATGGNVGGAWDSIHRKFDEARDTLLALDGPNVPLKAVERAKKLLSNTVNWIADNVSQESAKQISSAIENGVESIMRTKGIDMGAYQAQKRLYGASKLMQKGLQNEVSSQAGNNAVSLPTMVLGAGQLATGNVPGAAATIGLTEALRRRGAGVGARAIEGTGKFLSRQSSAREPAAALAFGTAGVGRLLTPMQPSADSVFKPRYENKRLFSQPQAGANAVSDSSQGDMAQPSYDGQQQPNQENQPSDIQSLPDHSQSIPPSKPLTKQKAREFLDQANGDKDLARKLASKAGYTW